MRSRFAQAGRGSPSREGRSPSARLGEAVGLARAIELDVVEAGLVPLAQVRPATYLGSGKVDEIAGIVRGLQIELVVIDAATSPIQQRNLETAWGTKVLDRTGLILEIFGQRARTREGALQVEHAHLTYQKGRLVRSWTHLERQRGGFGFLGGPGETQLESDRRTIDERIARIEVELDKVKRTRRLHRASRKRVPYPIAALVGYTNAGKSTVFNKLTRASVLAADIPFSTLDPTLRSMVLTTGSQVILSDTVGFISDLPTMLIAAFRATLEEVIEADLIIHVRDMAHDETEAQSADVGNVLETLGIDPGDQNRLLEVWNKIDLLTPQRRMELGNIAARRDMTNRPVLVSAATGEGLDELVSAIEGRLAACRVLLDLTLDPADGASVSWLYENAEVMVRSAVDDGRLLFRVRVDAKHAAILRRRFGLSQPA